MTNEEYINMIGMTDPHRSSWHADPTPVTPFYSYDRTTSSVAGPNVPMQDLYNTIMSANPVTVTRTNSTQTQRQNRSPEFEATARQFIDTLNQLAASTQQAYQGKQNTYTDLIRALSNLYGARGGAAAESTQSSALSSGLTPLEASQAGNQALLANLQQFFPALAGLRGEAADVGIGLQSALAGLQQQLNLPFISSVLAPYQQNVAGQVTRGQSTQTESNPLAKLQLLSQLSQAMESSKLQQQQIAQQGEGNALGWAQLAAQIQQNQAENQFGYAQLGQTAQEAQMQNALGLGNLGVAQGGLVAQLARLAQEGQQFSTSQQNNMDIARGNWANQLAQTTAQGQFNLMDRLPAGDIRNILGLPPLTNVAVEDVFGGGPTMGMGDTSGVTKWYGDPAALARINGVSLDEARLHVAAGQSR